MNHWVVLITGALTGIGRATAVAFAKDGARVVVAGRPDEAGEKLVTELRTLGTEAEYWRTDVRTKTKCEGWLIEPSRALVASMWRSTTPGSKASPVR